MSDFPLVSVIVVTYNSASFILETLESVFRQTYPRVELVITDDSSTDQTIPLVQSWIEQKGAKFENVKVVQSDANTGISKNANRGIIASNGDYIKFLAGDDILLDTCIENSLKYLNELGISFCFAKCLPFADTDNKHEIEQIINTEAKRYNTFFHKSQKGQFRSLLRLTIPLSMVISGFYKKNILDETNNFDELYEMMDDYPFMVKLALKGYEFSFLDEYTVKYRVRLGSIDESYKQSVYYTKFYNNLKSYRKTTIIPLMIKEHMYFSAIYLRILMILLELEKSSKSKIYHNTMSFLRGVKDFISIER